jgi:predicted ATP-grasp superfamily ATP-dependent carboligase
MTDTAERAFFERLHREPLPAFILGDATSHQLAFVRSLGRRGILVAALTLGRGPRLRSRYCALSHAFDDDTELLDFLRRAGAKTPTKSVLVPTGDGDVLFVSRHRRELDGLFRFALPDADSLERLVNKRSQYEYAVSLGVPVPRTCWPTNEQDLKQIAETLTFPCIIKPAHSHLWRRQQRPAMVHWPKAAHAKTPQELVTFYEQMRESEIELLIQERVKGDEDRLFSCYAYLDRNAEPLAAFVLQKRRQWPPVYGNGSYSVSCRQGEVVKLTLRLLKGLRYHGVANVEFKLDPKDEQLKLIELNCRGGNRMGLAVDAGIDLPYIAYCDLVGEPVAPVDAYESGITWIDFAADFAALPYYRRTQGLSLWAWARSAWEARSHAYLAADDPLPFFDQAGRFAAAAWPTWRAQVRSGARR